MEAICGASWGYRAVRLSPPPSPRPEAVAATSVRCDSRCKRMFVFGMGFVGRYVADRLKREGWEVSGTSRSANKKRELDEMGVEAFIFDVHKSELRSLPTLQHATHVLISIPPSPGLGDPLLSLHKDLRSTLSSGNLQWLCYLSSTSVYGDCGGALVDEDYPVKPKKESAKSRLSAEKGWLDLGHGLQVSVHVFRLGGIYGPGRSALDTIIKQKSMSELQRMRESRLYTARVHVADIYQAVKASFDVPNSGRVCNVVDDDPAPRAEVFAYAKALIDNRGLRPHDVMISELSFDCAINLHGDLQGEKLVSNARMKEELGVRLLHPTYRSGLRSILDSSGLSL